METKTEAQLAKQARKIVQTVIKKNMADAILFSAGTDTAIIAYEAVKINPKIPALTIAFKQGTPKDTQYVKAMVNHLKLNHKTYTFDKAEALKAMPKVVNVLKTFDPMEVRNSIPLQIGLELLKKDNVKSVFTGDGLDELFGYPWQFHLSEEDLQKNQRDIWAGMMFASSFLAEALGMQVKQPYLDPKFMDWAKPLPLKHKINMRNGIKFSKFILRQAYEDVLPLEVVWRPKAPLEQGTGADVFPIVMAQEFSDKQFSDKKASILTEDNVTIRDKEQLVYYEAFKRIFGNPSKVYPKAEGTQLCPKCQSHIRTRIGFCRVCGAYPI